MDPLIQATAVIIGLVNGIALAKDVKTNPWPFILFVCAIVTGLILGLAHWFGLTPETGLVVALGSSGFYKLAQKVGGK